MQYPITRRAASVTLLLFFLMTLSPFVDVANSAKSRKAKARARERAAKAATAKAQERPQRALGGGSPRSENYPARNQSSELQGNISPLRSQTSDMQGGIPFTTQGRDPFALTNKQMAHAEKPPSFGASGSDWTPMELSGKMPKMRLRGHIKEAGGKIAALLEIDGSGVYIVREKDTVGLQELGFDSALRIKKITRLHVLVEAGSLGRTIIVH